MLLGKYQIERELGRGGMGEVVAARHVELDEKVAIKFLLGQYSQHAELVGRFMREARAAARIRSEHVVRVSDVGRLETGEPYMVMEYLEGNDLEHEVNRRGALPVEQVVDWLLQAMEALAEAHRHRIVHRDLKPANLFLTHRADGSACVKVLDFGISKFTPNDGTPAAASMTRTQGMMGSPLYMSPEQLASAKEVDARTDIWALGVILYQLLTARFPFWGESLPQLIAQVMAGQLTSPRVHRPDLPDALIDIILRCLTPREQRFPDVASLAEALAPFASDEGRRSVARIQRTTAAGAAPTGPVEVLTPPPQPVPATVVAPPPVATQNSFGGTRPTEVSAAPRSKGLALGVGLAAVLAVGVTGFVLSQRRDPPPAQAPAKPVDDDVEKKPKGKNKTDEPETPKDTPTSAVSASLSTTAAPAASAPPSVAPAKGPAKKPAPSASVAVSAPPSAKTLVPDPKPALPPGIE